jgi:hypothetical protein
MSAEFGRQTGVTGIARLFVTYWHERNPAKSERFIDGRFRIEQRAIEHDLVAQLSPSKQKQKINAEKARHLRALLERVNKRNAEGRE